MGYTKKDQLIDRIENNYTDFKCSLYGVSRDKLFEMAGRIIAVTEAYEMLTKEYAWDEEGQIDFFLLFRDPLTIVADAWERRKNEITADFDDTMFNLSYDDTTISQYPLMEGVGDDILYIGDSADDKMALRSCKI